MVDQLLRFWWAFELFSPQKIPDVSDSVKSWTARRPLPWAQPAALSDGWMWEYTVYLSVYRSAAIYRGARSLQRFAVCAEWVGLPVSH